MVKALNRKKGKLDVVVAGLAVVDILGRPVNFARLPKPGGLSLLDSLTLATGGNVSNVGIDLVKLGFRVGAITRVGDDGFGEFIRAQYAAHGIDASGVMTDSREQTPATFVAIGRDGERTFFHSQGSLKRFTARDMLRHLPLMQRASIIAVGYLGLLPAAEPDFPQLFAAIKRRTQARVLLDTGGMPRMPMSRLRRVLPHVDFFIPSYEEAVALTGEERPEMIVRALFAAGAPGVVGVKLGARGCYVACAGTGMGVTVPPVRVRRVVDATGAGDSFVAGFLAATLKGFDPCDAAAVGNAVAASCVTAVGASTAIQHFSSYVRS